MTRMVALPPMRGLSTPVIVAELVCERGVSGAVRWLHGRAAECVRDASVAQAAGLSDESGVALRRAREWRLDAEFVLGTHS